MQACDFEGVFTKIKNEKLFETIVDRIEDSIKDRYWKKTNTKDGLALLLAITEGARHPPDLQWTDQIHTFHHFGTLPVKQVDQLKPQYLKWTAVAKEVVFHSTMTPAKIVTNLKTFLAEFPSLLRTITDAWEESTESYTALTDIISSTEVFIAEYLDAKRHNDQKNWTDSKPPAETQFPEKPGKGSRGKNGRGRRNTEPDIRVPQDQPSAPNPDRRSSVPDANKGQNDESRPKIICRNFANSGHCSYGASCKFEHRSGPPPAEHSVRLLEAAPENTQENRKEEATILKAIQSLEARIAGLEGKVQAHKTRITARRKLFPESEYNTPVLSNVIQPECIPTVNQQHPQQPNNHATAVPLKQG